MPKKKAGGKRKLADTPEERAMKLEMERLKAIEDEIHRAGININWCLFLVSLASWAHAWNSSVEGLLTFQLKFTFRSSLVTWAGIYWDADTIMSAGIMRHNLETSLKQVVCFTHKVLSNCVFKLSQNMLHALFRTRCDKTRVKQETEMCKLNMAKIQHSWRKIMRCVNSVV